MPTQKIYFIDQIIRANERGGFNFFDKGSMRFFRSRILPTVYGGRFFVTSEADPLGGRSYTVREFNPENGNVGTAHGETFMAHRTRRAAVAAARHLAANGCPT